MKQLARKDTGTTELSVGQLHERISSFYRNEWEALRIYKFHL